jgi:phospholipase C
VEPGGTELRNWHPSGFTFNRYGPRVPAILVSPYIPARSIVRPAGFSYVQGYGTSTTNGETPFDHTSVIRTIVECFDICNGAAHLTNRDKNAPSLADALSLDANHKNNGPRSVELPVLPVGPTTTKHRSSHLADIYVAAKARVGAANLGHHLAVWSRRFSC